MAEQEDAPQGADNPTPDQTSGAGAEDALRAAEGSVEKLKQEQASSPPTASAGVSEKASAALAAAKAALAAAKSAQGGASPMEAAMAAMAGGGGGASGGASGGATSATGSPVSLPNLQPGSGKPAALPSELDLLADVNLNVKIELGRTRMLVEDVLRLNEGSVVELDKLAGDPVDVFVNERHVARGEVLVVNDSFCIRISEILDAEAKENS